MKSNFFRYYISVFYQPKIAFRQLLANEQRLRFGFYAVLIMAVLYTLVYVFLTFGGGHPYKPWLPIAPEVYYRYNVFFLAPSMFCGWLLAASFAYFLNKLFHSEPKFIDILCVFGFGIGIASWSTGLHDLVTSFLGAVHLINQRQYEVALNSPTVWRTLLWIQMLAYVLWFCILFSIGIKVSAQTKRHQAIFIAVFSFIVYQLFFFIFNR